MNKSAKIINWLNSEMFNFHVMFSCGFTMDEIRMHLKKKKALGWLESLSQEKPLDECLWGKSMQRIVVKDGKSVTYFHIIIKDQFDFSDESMINLAHEVLHICQFALPDILERDKEIECEAYLHSHLMRQCLNKLR